MIPLLILFLTIILLILIHLYRTKKYCFKEDIQSISIISDNTVASEEPPKIDDYTRPRTTDRLKKNVENNYEKVNVDRRSLVGQQHFVPISTSIHFFLKTSSSSIRYSFIHKINSFLVLINKDSLKQVNNFQLTIFLDSISSKSRNQLD